MSSSFKLKYDLSKMIKTVDELKQKPAPVLKIRERKNLRNVACCANCIYSWFPKTSERRGYCRFGLLKKTVAVSAKIPHPSWEPVYITLICSSYTAKKHAAITKVIHNWTPEAKVNMSRSKKETDENK